MLTLEPGQSKVATPPIPAYNTTSSSLHSLSLKNSQQSKSIIPHSPHPTSLTAFHPTQTPHLKLHIPHSSIPLKLHIQIPTSSASATQACHLLCFISLASSMFFLKLLYIVLIVSSCFHSSTMTFACSRRCFVVILSRAASVSGSSSCCSSSLLRTTWCRCHFQWMSS